MRRDSRQNTYLSAATDVGGFGGNGGGYGYGNDVGDGGVEKCGRVGWVVRSLQNEVVNVLDYSSLVGAHDR